MTTLALEDDQVVISIDGWDKLFSLKGEVTFPKSSITSAYAYNETISPPWLKNPGTAIPGVIMAGTFQNLGDRKEFWCTKFKGNTVVIDLDHETYTRVVCDLPSDESVKMWVANLTS